MLGIFDSGIGRLTVVKELLTRHPDVGFVYLGDTARTPYGNKSPDTIRRYAIEDARFLVEQGATTIFVALLYSLMSLLLLYKRQRGSVLA